MLRPSFSSQEAPPQCQALLSDLKALEEAVPSGGLWLTTAVSSLPSSARSISARLSSGPYFVTETQVSLGGGFVVSLLTRSGDPSEIGVETAL